MGLSDDGFGICRDAAELGFGGSIKVRTNSYSMPLNHHEYDSSIRSDLGLDKAAIR
jgi:hypothetical protein